MTVTIITTPTEEVVVTEEELDDAIYRHALCAWCYPASDFQHTTATGLCGTVYATGLVPVAFGRIEDVPLDACPKCIEVIANPPVVCPVCTKLVIAA